MIHLTRLSCQPFVLNAEMIQEIEATPDTIVTLNSGQKIMVQETVDAVKDAVLDYKRTILGGYGPPLGD